MEIFPIDFFESPLITSDNYSEQSNFIETKVSQGNSVRRRIYTQTEGTVTVQFILTTEQIFYFRGWIKNQINGGADWFLIDLELGDAGLTTCQCRISEAKQLYRIDRAAPGNKKIQISLEIREAPAPTKDEVTIYLNNLRLWINWWNAATKYMAEDLPAQIDPFTFTETAGDNFNNFINDDLAEDVNP